MNKIIDSVESEDEIKKTDTQKSIPDDDEESVDDIDESESEEAEGEEGEEEGDEKETKKTFKTRQERAEFFKNKKKKVPESKDTDAFTKADLYKMNEKTAIRNLTEVLESDTAEQKQYKTFVDDRWDDIVQHINMRTVDKLDVKSYEKAIRRAVVIVKSEDTDEEDTSDTEARKRIMADGGAKGSTSNGTPKKKTSILGPSSKGMDDWFPKKD